MPFISLENLQLTTQGIQIALKDVWNSIKNKANKSELVQSDYAQYDDTKLDYIKNRTHYDTRRIETIEYSFDGNLNNREVICDGRIPIGFVKLSDDIYPPSTWEGGILNIVNEGIAHDLEITHNSITVYEGPNGEITSYDISGSYFVVNPRDEHIQISPNISLPKGTWARIEMYMNNDPSNLRSYGASITSGPIQIGELKKLDEKYLPPLQSDWNQNDETATDYIKNKTHYDTRTTKTVTYKFDGKYFDTWEGEKVDLNGDGTMYYLKLSDDVPNITDFVGCTQIVVDDGVLTSTTITEDNTDWYADAGHGIYVTVAFVLVTETIDNFPMSPGLWAICKFVDGAVVSYTVQASYKKVIGGELQQLDEKYIPDTIMRAPTVDDALELVAELGLAEPMTDDEGKVLTDENGVLFIL